MNKENLIKQVRNLLNSYEYDNSPYILTPKIWKIVFLASPFIIFPCSIFYISLFEYVFFNQLNPNSTPLTVIVFGINGIIVSIIHLFVLFKGNINSKKLQLENWKIKMRKIIVLIIIFLFIFDFLIFPVLVYFFEPQSFLNFVYSLKNIHELLIFPLLICYIFFFTNLLIITYSLLFPNYLISVFRLGIFKFCIIFTTVIFYLTAVFVSNNLRDSGIISPENDQIFGLFIVPYVQGLLALGALITIIKHKAFNENIFLILFYFIDVEKINLILKNKFELINDKKKALEIYHDIESNYDINVKLEVIKLIDESRPKQVGEYLSKTFYSVVWIIIALLVGTLIYNPIANKLCPYYPIFCG